MSPADDPRILDADELETIARRVNREQVYRDYTDCSQAVADRRHLLGHILALARYGELALGALAGAETLDLDAARRLVRERQDAAAEAPDDEPRPRITLADG